MPVDPTALADDIGTPAAPGASTASGPPAPQHSPSQRPDLTLTSTDPRALFAETMVEADGTTRELGMREMLAQPLSAPALTVPATHTMVGAAVASVLDGRIRTDVNGNIFNATATGWEQQTPRQVSSLIKGLITRPDGESRITRALIPYRDQKLNNHLADQLMASGAATIDPLNQCLRWAHDGTQVHTVPVPDNEWAESTDTAAKIRDDILGRDSVVMTTGFDTSPLLINAQGTVLDLGADIVNGVCDRPLSRHDLMAKSLFPEFDPYAECPQWLRFVAEVTSVGSTARHRPEVARFLQVLVGLSLLGKVQEQVAAVLAGIRGNNGKSVFMDVLLYLAGTYGVTLPRGFLQHKRIEGHSTDLTMLEGARIGYVPETPPGLWAVELLKILVSREPVTARGMRENNRSWDPTHMLWVTTNNAPAVPPGEQAFWRRIKIIPCLQRWYDEGERAELKAASIGPTDPGLTDKLKAESAGILNWALTGLQMYYADGKLIVPQAVQDATEDARCGASVWAGFLADTISITKEPTDQLTVKEVWALWDWYRQEQSQHRSDEPTTQQKLARALLAECPGVEMAGGRTPGARTAPKGFAGIALTDAGKEWADALGTQGLRGVPGIRGAVA